MNQVVTELTIDARGAEVGSAAYVRSMQVAQAAVDRLRERELALQTSQDSTGATMLSTSTSVTSAARSYDRLKASIDPLFAASKSLERDILTLDRAVTRLGVSETEVSRVMDLVVLKHDAAAAAAKRQTDEYLRLADAGRQAQAGDRAQTQFNSLLGVQDTSPGSARMSAGVFMDADRDAEAYQRRLAAVRAEIDPLTAAIERMNSELAEQQVMLARGDISAQQFASGQRLAQQRVDEVQTHLNNQNRSRASGGNLMASINAGQQMQDILVTSMMGQGIGTIALQQGSQLGSAALMSGAGERGRFGLLNSLKSAATELANPVMLGAVAFTAITAASIKFFTSGSDGAKQLTDLMKEHNSALKQVEDGYKSVDLVARGTGRQSQLVSGFQSQQSIEALRRGYNRDAAFGTLDTQLLVGREEKFGLLGGTPGDVEYLIQAEDAALGLGDAIRELMVGIESGYPNVLKFNDQLAAMGQAPGASKALKDRIAEILEFTKGLGDAQAAIRAYDQNFGPDGKLRSASPFNRQDMQNYDRWRIENDAAIRNQGRQFDAEVGSLGARSPSELAAAARAREEATFNMDESAGLRRARIANAETLARKQAEQALNDTIEQRGRALTAAAAQQRNDISLIGQTAGETAKLRFEFEQLSALREWEAQNRVTASEKEIADIKRTAEEVGRLVDQQSRLKLQEDIAYERRQIGRSPVDQTVADRLRGAGLGENLQSEEAREIRLNEVLRTRSEIYRDLQFERDQLARTEEERQIASRLRDTGIGMDSAEANQMRINAALERQVKLWQDIRQSGMDAYNDIFDLAFDGFDNWEDVLGDMAKNWAREIGKMGWLNPMLNERYPEANLPTLDMTGGIGGFFKTMLGMTGNPAAQAVGAMQVQAAVVNINGQGLGGIAQQMFNPAGSGGLTDGNLGSWLLGNAKSTAAAAPQFLSGIGSPTTAMRGNASLWRDAIASIESAGSGDYAALGPIHAKMGQALGRYQIMEANLPAWSKAALGRNVGRAEFMANPNIQDAIFDKQFGGYVDRFGERGAAQAWFGGPGSVGKLGRQDVLGTSVGGYGDKFVAAMDRMGAKTGAASTALERMTTQSAQATQGLGTLGTGFDQFGKNLANAFPAAPSAPAGGGGGGLGSLFSGLFSMFTPWEMNYFNNPVNVGLWHSGRFPGGGRNYVADDPAAYASAMRYHNGRYPLAPDEERAIIKRDEVIFRDWSQAQQVVGGGRSPGKTEMHFHNAPSVERQDEVDDGNGGTRMDIWFDKQVASAAGKRGGATAKMFGGMGFNRPSKVR